LTVAMFLPENPRTADCLIKIFVCVTLMVGIILTGSSARALPEGWAQKVTHIRWIAYSPPSADPTKEIEATPDAIQGDLRVLRQAGFTGLITYGSLGVMGCKLLQIAGAKGFQGLIMGIWDPNDQKELAAAAHASGSPIVLGYCVGNEGLMKRYQRSELIKAMQYIREATGKPVTTTEELHDYADKEFRSLVGDWLFPNVHPYFYNILDPENAALWTQGAFEALKKKSDKFILFKEVGLPTAGDAAGKLSEENQKFYYLILKESGVNFAYFEAFDQPWKTHLPVEPHWGIFRSNRTPKALAMQLIRDVKNKKTLSGAFLYPPD